MLVLKALADKYSPNNQVARKEVNNLKLGHVGPIQVIAQPVLFSALDCADIDAAVLVCKSC